ncbi:GNAT family N-acetyltransferase [Chromatiaceae bacterium AAb-1]|nr:GNAT family N-acetyltransferase [Chromatiaceae bacterium AAb-1]
MLLQQVVPLLTQAGDYRLRLPVIYQGNNQQLLSDCYQLLEHLQQQQEQTVYWIGDQPATDTVHLTASQHYPLLGSECDVLVINAFGGFAAELVAASAGCLKAGGLWLLLCPPFTEWQTRPNPAHSKLLPYPLNASQHRGFFTAFFQQQLHTTHYLQLSTTAVIRPFQWPEPYTASAATAPFRTAEQQQAAEAIHHVVSGHRRRPLVLTADRGRGKSAVLGIAAARLAAAGKKQLVITAPTPRTAAVALSHFRQHAAESDHQALNFIPVDQLLRQVIPADLLLVDEAAAIPEPQLQQLLQRYSRIVFATTEHGYEGTGRGFQLRFQHYLQQQAPGWRKLHLHQPIRYRPDDPLEQLIFRTFLLNVTPPELPASDAPLTLQRYKAADWLQQTAKLQQVFSLLSLAHYQTKVSDLLSLLENPQLEVFTIEQQHSVLACALISYEGFNQPELAQQVYRGERRIQGHLLTQSLAFHLASPELATLPAARIMRIAVQPQRQQRGIGSRLLRQVIDELSVQGIELFGTSFGITMPLLNFWQSAGFAAVRLGVSADKASGEHSVLMFYISGKPQMQLLFLQQQFATQLPEKAAEWFKTLEPPLLLKLASPVTSPITPAEAEQLQLFSQGKRPYELISLLLLRWFNLHYQQLPADKAGLLCARLWQHQSWEQLASRFDLSGKAEIQQQFRQSLAALLP